MKDLCRDFPPLSVEFERQADRSRLIRRYPIQRRYVREVVVRIIEKCLLVRQVVHEQEA
jgi:hypothetical protein